MITNHWAKPETDMPNPPAKIRGNATFPSFFFPFSLLIYLFMSAGFVLEEEAAVNKHGHDSVEVLPVSIKWERHHCAER